MLPLAAAIASISILALVAWQAALMQRIGGWGRPPLPKRPAGQVAGPPPKGAFPRLVHFLGQRRWARRTLSAGSGLALLVAVGMLGFPFYTNLVQSRIQARLDRELASPDLRKEYLSRSVKEGESLTRIKIPAIGVDVVVVEGTGADALRAGAGHYRNTPLPCENGNVAIAGHRTTYGRPFANVDLLKPGDKITLETPIGSCVYTIQPVPAGRNAASADGAAFVIEPTDISVIANSVKPELTLTSCHPKGSAAKRIIIKATMDGPPAPSAGSA